jgi:hypothetical protein
MVIGLSLTKGQGEEFDKETLRRLQTQKTIFTNVNLQRLQEKKLKIAKQQAEIKKQKMLKTSENLKIKTQTINLDLADKISKIIPYSLIPIIPIAVAYFVFKGSK